MAIYALRADTDKALAVGVKLFESIQQGVGRFGWSNVETADLNALRTRIEQHGWDGWDDLSADERNCYLPFLLELVDGDYVVYINMPEYGQCTLARVIGPYFWEWTHEDFNHRFPVAKESVLTFNRNAQIVDPELRQRLRLRGKWWRIYLEEAFYDLQQRVQRGEGGEAATLEGDLAHLAQQLRPVLNDITGMIHRAFPAATLESFLEKVFKKIPGVVGVVRTSGPKERGADLLVDFDSGFPIPDLREQKKLVVQVKSFEGPMDDQKALKQIQEALDSYNADMGLIFSTAENVSPEFSQKLEALQQTTEKPVGLLVGSEVARFVLRFGSDLLD